MTLPLLSGAMLPDRPDRPVGVLQFGTGRFLMGFLGDFLDRAGLRAVIVQQTGIDKAHAIAEQDGLYTLVKRGEGVDERRLIDAYAGALTVAEDGERLTAIACSPDLHAIVSNVTEAGLATNPADALEAPVSYPARLTALLHARWRAGQPGLAIVPCELIEDNGALVARLVREMAAHWALAPAFQDWLTAECVFPNTLVDRIVTGLPNAENQAEMEAEIGYRDALLTVCEPYALFAIEGDAALAQRLGFVAGNPVIRVEPDIRRYRDLKLRLLNGGHSASAAVAILLGHGLVRDAMADPRFARFIDGVLTQEIAPTIAVPIEEARGYAADVLTRWRNPAIEHHWRDIATGYVAKVRNRLAAPIAASDGVPERLAIGMAALIVLMRDADSAARAGWEGALPLTAPAFTVAVAKLVARIDEGGLAPLLDGID